MAEPTQTDEIQGDMSPLVVTLAEAAGLDPTRMEALLGTKAANLARLAGGGFPVPPGVVVTPAAEADWDQAFARLRSAAAELGGRDQRFAVRSSATAEDLAGASYAGQYETVLDVRLDELPRRCNRWWTPPPRRGCRPTGRPTPMQPQRTRPGRGWRSWCRSWWRPGRPGLPSLPTR
jgi:hypothetical protein